MSASLHNNGENYALVGTGIAAKVAKIKLYTSSSVPSKSGVEGTDFLEVPNGSGYTTGGQSVVSGDWTYSVVAGTGQIVLNTYTWTASGTITGVAGVYLTDSSNNVIAWASRPVITLLSGDVLTVSGLTITG